MEFRAEAKIDAPAEVVWGILTELERYPEWDKSCIKIEGRIGLGERLRAFSHLSPGRAFKARVTELEAPRSMTWSGGMPFGLFRGVRRFVLEPAEGGLRFSISESFSGPMLKLIAPSIPDMNPTFADFAAALKERAEAAATKERP